MLNSDQIANLAHKQVVDSRLDMAKLGWSILISIGMFPGSSEIDLARVHLVAPDIKNSPSDKKKYVTVA
jgi:hypothetical protein